MKTITTVTNKFTGYSKTIRTNGLPAVATIQKHLRASKARDCKSVTRVLTNVDETGAGDEISVYDGEIYVNGVRA